VTGVDVRLQRSGYHWKPAALGIKAAVNGASTSILDGWWAGASMATMTGAFGRGCG
jgi:hypothetical protein